MAANDGGLMTGRPAADRVLAAGGGSASRRLPFQRADADASLR